MRERSESPFLSLISLSIKLRPITLATVLSLSSVKKRFASSPPSPVFDLPPIRFIAIANVVCASVEIDPNDIAPVAKRLTISLADSTSSMGIALSLVFNLNNPRKVI